MFFPGARCVDRGASTWATDDVRDQNILITRVEILSKDEPLQRAGALLEDEPRAAGVHEAERSSAFVFWGPPGVY